MSDAEMCAMNALLNATYAALEKPAENAAQPQEDEK